MLQFGSEKESLKVTVLLESWALKTKIHVGYPDVQLDSGCRVSCDS